MMVTAHNRVIPLSIPLGFVLLGEVFWLVALLLWAFHPEAILTPRHPWGLAVATCSFWALGWGCSSEPCTSFCPWSSRRPFTARSGGIR